MATNVMTKLTKLAEDQYIRQNPRRKLEPLSNGFSLTEFGKRRIVYIKLERDQTLNICGTDGPNTKVPIGSIKRKKYREEILAPLMKKSVEFLTSY